MTRSYAAAACAALLSFGAGSVAFAAPAAMIFDLSGPTTPAAAPLSEVEAGVVLRLDPATEMFVVHYASCKELHVRGGVLTFGAVALELSDGAETLAETVIECPTKVAFAEEAGQTASVVMRGDGGALAINARPHFVILGGGGGVQAVRIMKDGAEAARLPVSGGLARPAAGAAPLAAGGGYQIIFETAEGPRAAKAAVVAGAGATIVSP